MNIKNMEFKESTLDCPQCKQKLFIKEVNNRIVIWCGRANCSKGTNEGFAGKNEEAAFKIMLQKLGYL